MSMSERAHPSGATADDSSHAAAEVLDPSRGGPREATDEVASHLPADTVTPTAGAEPTPRPNTPTHLTTPPQPTTQSVDLATLQSVDLATIILTERAKATRGWCQELAATAAVCSAWREALQVVEKTAWSWHTLTWRVKAFSQLCKSKAPDEGIVVRAEAGSGVHDWQLWLVPRACRHEQPQEDDDEAQRLVEVLGVYLQVPSPLECADGWARRTEAEMTLHHATDPKASRRRYFRHRFTAAVTDWGHPDQMARSSFGESTELARPAAGFVTDDTLTITARVRVSPGRPLCIPVLNVHPYAPRPRHCVAEPASPCTTGEPGSAALHQGGQGLPRPPACACRRAGVPRRGGGRAAALPLRPLQRNRPHAQAAPLRTRVQL
jgi:hypothetical protein